MRLVDSGLGTIGRLEGPRLNDEMGAAFFHYCPLGSGAIPLCAPAYLGAQRPLKAKRGGVVRPGGRDNMWDFSYVL
jgi:hypothetical protein